MKVIFLDFDGVINSMAFYARCQANASWPAQHIDAVNVAVLQKIVDEIGPDKVSIVISSTWRLSHRLSELRGFLHTFGLERGDVIGRTPNLPSRYEYKMQSYTATRGHEIHKWLVQNWVAADVDSFVILDDAEDMWRLKRKFVWINDDEGLTEKYIDPILVTLNACNPALQDEIMELAEEPRVQALWERERDVFTQMWQGDF